MQKDKNRSIQQLIIDQNAKVIYVTLGLFSDKKNYC